MKIITCETCSKVTGAGVVGTEWICQDCRVVPNGLPVRFDGTRRESEQPSSTEQ